VNAVYGSYVGAVQGEEQIAWKAVQYQDPDAKPAGAYWLAWNGDGTVSWSVSSPKSMECDLNLCYASASSGAPAVVSLAGQRLERTLGQTKGYWPDELNNPMNFERVPLAGKLRLSEGENIIRLRISGSRGTVRVRSLELVPLEAKENLRKDAERARASRASTDWFVGAGYGLFIHWTSQVQPLKGEQKPYAEAVGEFNVPEFASLVEETGAGYLILTANHADPTFPAPIKSWEHYHPGWTTQRDLIGEIADELAKRDIRLIVYMAADIVGGVHSRLVSTQEYQTTLESTWTEIGNRYGERVAGYWFDHGSWSKENYPNLSYRSMWKAVKAGNPHRLVAYNFWQFPVMTEWQDYWANEAALQRPPESRYMTVGPAKGLQYHAAVPIDGAWLHLTPNSAMENPIWSDEQVVDFVRGCIAHQGVVSLAAAISQDLHMSDSTLHQLRLVRRAIRGK
jgi:hypothetical protein